MSYMTEVWVFTFHTVFSSSATVHDLTVANEPTTTATDIINVSNCIFPKDF